MDDAAVKSTANLIDECNLEHKELSKLSESKNSSLEEDLLGVNSLLLSDSSDSSVDLYPLGEDGAETITQEQIEEKGVVNENVNVEETISREFSKHRDELEQVNDYPIEIPNIEAGNEGTSIAHKKKWKGLLNTSSEADEDEDVEREIASKMRKKISVLIDSDSESVDEKPNTSRNASNKYKLLDSESGYEKEEKRGGKAKKIMKKKRHKIKPDLIDSDSDSETNRNVIIEREKDLQQMQLNDEGEQQQQRKPIRASAKRALDEMQAIQSQQQRLHREAQISVPYHKPKHYTLQEFLKRRTIIKPTAERECSPAAATMQRRSLKMTREELEEYAQLMEERAIEATEFFKSETEKESEEEALQTNPDAMGDIKQNERQDKVEKKEEVVPANNDIETSKKDESTSTIPVFIAHHRPFNDKMAVQTDKGDDTHINCLVTEVIELPNLDLSSFNVNGVPPSSTFEKADSLKQQLPILHNGPPTIKGDPNMLIDLESGDMISKKSTGVDNLLDRLLSTHKARKSRTMDTVNILSTENGKLEMTKVNIHIHDDEDVTKDQKPGAAYVKLKQNLKCLIKNKRLEEVQKKKMEENEYNKCLEESDDDGESFDDGDSGEEYETPNEDEAKMATEDLFEDERLELIEKQRPDEITIKEEEKALDPNDLNAEEKENEEEEDYDNDDELLADEKYENDTEEDEGVENQDNQDTSDSECDELKRNELLSLNQPSSNSQRKSRIIRAFEADSDENYDDIDLLKTQIPIEQSNIEIPMFGDIDSPVKDSMRIPCSNVSIDNTQELLNLCSGTFDATQNHLPPKTDDMAVMSQIPVTQPTHLNAATEDELLALCSGTFGTESLEQTQTKTRDTMDFTLESMVKPVAYKFLSSDEAEAGGSHVEAQLRVKKLRKKLKKRQVKLGFSDDEDDDDEEQNGIEMMKLHGGEGIEGEETTEMAETYVEYDSEENEIIVEMTKKDCIKRAENFFEKEAELSESDWGSADEDEKNLDRYDIELGDEDEFDRGKLQQELGQIHARKMLDEDIREVRKIQEMLFEDEETDGVGRQRQFRWKNVENGFSLDEMRAYGGEENANTESGDEEQKQEHRWRRIRFERQQFLKECELKQGTQDSTSPKSLLKPTIAGNSNSNKNMTEVLINNGKKLQIITKKKTSNLSALKQKGSPFLISNKSMIKTTAAVTVTTPPSAPGIFQHKIARGSFLRDKETLTRFANIAKGKAGLDADDETAGTVSAKGKNFVFSTITREEHENLKRKADELLDSSIETGKNFMKKPCIKVDKTCVIDQLQM